MLRSLLASTGRLIGAVALFYTVYSASPQFKSFIDTYFNGGPRNQLAVIVLAFLTVEFILAMFNQERRIALATRSLNKELDSLHQSTSYLESQLAAQPPLAHRKITPEDFESALISYIKDLSSRHSVRHVMRLHSALSRYLWVEGLLNARVALGEAAEAAASELNDQEGQLSALVDDLGWTLVAKKEYQKATEKIEFGKHLAQRWSRPYWIAKAHRHLAGIAVILRKFEDADSHLRDAENALAGMSENDTEKQAMLAGVEYARAINDLMRGQYDAALQHIEKSDELRLEGGDPTRIVRSFALRGKILLAKNDLISIGEAKNQFRQGLARATDLGRRDEIIRNHNGLARIAVLEKDEETAKYHRKRSQELSRDTPVPYEIEDEQEEEGDKHA